MGPIADYCPDPLEMDITTPNRKDFQIGEKRKN